MGTCGICLEPMYCGVRLPMCNCKILYHIKCYVKAYSVYGCPTCRLKSDYMPVLRGIIACLYLNVALMVAELFDSSMPLYYSLIFFCLLSGLAFVFLTDVQSDECLIKIQISNRCYRLSFNALREETLSIFVIITAVSLALPLSATVQLSIVVAAILIYVHLL